MLDLYCGVGGFALHAAVLGEAAPTRVIGIEVSPEAVASAEHTALRPGRRSWPAARSPSGVGDATDVAALDLTDVAAPHETLVVVNPPRRGVGPELASWLEESGAGQVIYSSCNVDSLARDLARLPSYGARHARLFDMFPQTAHHEVMVLLQRRATETSSPTGAPTHDRDHRECLDA